jgi:hypothetical protein
MHNPTWAGPTGVMMNADDARLATYTRVPGISGPGFNAAAAARHKTY